MRNTEIVLRLQHDIVIPTQVDDRTIGCFASPEVAHLKRLEAKGIGWIEDANSARTSLSNQLTRAAQPDVPTVAEAGVYGTPMVLAFGIPESLAAGGGTIAMHPRCHSPVQSSEFAGWTARSSPGIRQERRNSPWGDQTR